MANDNKVYVPDDFKPQIALSDAFALNTVIYKLDGIQAVLQDRGDRSTAQAIDDCRAILDEIYRGYVEDWTDCFKDVALDD